MVPELNSKRGAQRLVDALDKHIDTSKVFWDEDFLGMIVDNCSFQHWAIVMYDNGFNFMDSLNCGRAWHFGECYKRESFQNQDYLAHFISDHFDEISRSNRIVKSSAVLPEDYKDYTNILNDSGLQYAAVLPIDQTYRLTAYKETAAGDFSDEEIAVLQDMMSLIKFGYGNFKKQRTSHTLSRVKTSLLDNLGIGCITLDKGFHVIDCNELATYNSQAIWNEAGSDYITDHILEMFPDVRRKQQIQKNGYMVTLVPYREVGYYGDVQQYYSVVMTKESQWRKLQERKNSEFPFFTLSARELEVLDLFAQGTEYKDISDKLFISEGTLRTHLKNIYRKLNISNQRKLIYEYVKYCQNNT